jgi:hypothetical protein
MTRFKSAKSVFVFGPMVRLISILLSLSAAWAASEPLTTLAEVRGIIDGESRRLNDGGVFPWKGAGKVVCSTP